MFIDSRRVDSRNTPSTGVVIVGGGPAGLSLAMRLARLGIASTVLESGSFNPDNRSLQLYAGDSVGLKYGLAEGHRNRYLGGNSNCWGGFCKPWDDWHFGRRPWVADSGWPIGARDLARYYEKAARTLKLGSDDYDAASWVKRIDRSDVWRYDLDAADWRDGVSLLSPPVKFGEDYREELKDSTLIRVYLWANAYEIETDPSGEHVRSIVVKTLSGNEFRVRGNQYVLAAGGIENARLMLASNRSVPQGVGNGNDLVGRYFSDHPRAYWGKVHLAPDQRANRFYDITFNWLTGKVGHGQARASAYMSLPLNRQREEGLLDAHVWMRSVFLRESPDLRMSLARTKQRLLSRQRYGFGFADDVLTLARQPLASAAFTASYLARSPRLMSHVTLEAIVEPTAERDSRVTLSDQVDALGMRRSRVDWRLSNQVARTFDRTFNRIADSLEKAGIATIERDPCFEQHGWPDSLDSTWHPMGTTRMHDSPRQGVVDRNCRVHGLSNLYAAGSSVFTTCAANHPTMTLVALSLRLADHLRDVRRKVETEASEASVA